MNSPSTKKNNCSPVATHSSLLIVRGKIAALIVFLLATLTSFSQSGTIIVNGSSTWPVSYNTKFPIWLPGSATASVNIGSNVTSISGILYNITSDAAGAGGNILTLNSVVNITSSTPIVAGTALKIEGILFTSATGSGGNGTNWVVGGNSTGGAATLGTNDNSVLSIQSGTGAMNIGADAGAKTITIGTSSDVVNVAANNINQTAAGTATLSGTTNINTTGSAATTVGNAGSPTTVGGALSINGNLSKINGAAYNWPVSSTSNSGYVLTNDGSGNLTWSSVIGAVETAGATPGATSSSYNSATWNTPGAYMATVPSGVTQITVDMAGAQGGTGNTANSSFSLGGYGGRMVAKYPVTAGSTIYISVGGAGSNYSTATGGSGGYLNDANGGTGGTYTTSGPYLGGGGGGASDIRIGGTALANRVLVAGGGGAGGGEDAGNNSDQGGPGGATTTATGAGYQAGVQYHTATACGVSCGGGGTPSGPGTAGCWTGYCTQSAGGSGNGGASNNCADGGGGGGGGYYGGGGGDWAGGGGGANYAGASAVSPVSTTGYQGSSWFSAPLNGYVTIYWH